jgi:hypothetical protein
LDPLAPDAAQGGVEDLRINFVDIFVKLLLSFFVPTAIGKGLRELVRGGCWAVAQPFPSHFAQHFGADVFVVVDTLTHALRQR